MQHGASNQRCRTQAARLGDSVTRADAGPGDIVPGVVDQRTWLAVGQDHAGPAEMRGVQAARLVAEAESEKRLRTGYHGGAAGRPGVEDAAAVDERAKRQV